MINCACDIYKKINVKEIQNQRCYFHVTTEGNTVTVKNNETNESWVINNEIQ